MILIQRKMIFIKKKMMIIFIEQNRTYALPVVGMGPSWPSIEHSHSGITAHLETVTFNVCETLNLRV